MLTTGNLKQVPFHLHNVRLELLCGLNYHAGTLNGNQPKPGSPYSQAQVGDIGLMGGPAKLDGKAVEGVRIMVRSDDPDLYPNSTLTLTPDPSLSAGASLAVLSRSLLLAVKPPNVWCRIRHNF